MTRLHTATAATSDPRMDAERRSWLRGVAGVAGLVALSGCGFALRKAPQLAFSAVRVQGGNEAGVTRELRRALENSGVQVFTSASSAGDATEQAVIEVLQDQRERAVVGQTATGQVRELQLRTRFRFALRTPAGEERIPSTELLLERDISFTETAVLAKEAEEALLYRDMQSDIVQQVMRRLAAVSAL